MKMYLKWVFGVTIAVFYSLSIPQMISSNDWVTFAFGVSLFLSIVPVGFYYGKWVSKHD